MRIRRRRRKQIEFEEFKQVVSGWLFDYHNTHYGADVKLGSIPMCTPKAMQEWKQNGQEIVFGAK